MNIDLSNPPYAVKLNDLGFAYSYTDRKKGIIVYTHADPDWSAPNGLTIGTTWNASSTSKMRTA
ncbi:hypothetical protein [Bifidobacterium pseudocatenulatum]|uniref:hypothetical protein n=1 Tax=Bifidobacterium pseudocatenulatum TaxID=28026 RepID=UPI0035644301